MPETERSSHARTHRSFQVSHARVYWCRGGCIERGGGTQRCEEHGEPVPRRTSTALGADVAGPAELSMPDLPLTATACAGSA